MSAKLQLLLSFMTTQEGYSKIKLAKKDLTMTLVLQDGESKMGLSFGIYETLGVLIGE